MFSHPFTSHNGFMDTCFILGGLIPSKCSFPYLNSALLFVHMEMLQAHLTFIFPPLLESVISPRSKLKHEKDHSSCVVVLCYVTMIMLSVSSEPVTCFPKAPFSKECGFVSFHFILLLRDIYSIMEAHPLFPKYIFNCLKKIDSSCQCHRKFFCFYVIR